MHAVKVAGAEVLQPWTDGGDATEPLILACTHGSWWDAATTIVLSLRTFHLDAIGMMEYKQLERYRFFSRLGMFSVVREDPRSALRSLRYAAAELRDRRRVAWMFPQGTLVHQEVQPVVCEPGIGILASMLPSVWICPVALRYELLHEQHPDVWIRFGTPQRVCLRDDGASVTSIVRDCSAALTSCATQVRTDAMTSNAADYSTVISGRRSMEKSYDAVRGRKP